MSGTTTVAMVLLSVCFPCRKLPEKQAKLFVGGVKESFSKLDLKVKGGVSYYSLST